MFDGQFYDQVDGVAMRSPLGPVLANIFICDGKVAEFGGPRLELC